MECGEGEGCVFENSSVDVGMMSLLPVISLSCDSPTLALHTSFLFLPLITFRIEQCVCAGCRVLWCTEAFLLAEKVPGLDKACMTLLNLQGVERLQHQLHLYIKRAR